MNKNLKYLTISILFILTAFLLFNQNTKGEKSDISQIIPVIRDSIQKKENQTVTLLFVGDIMLSRSIGDLMEGNNDWKFPFLEIADFLKSADLTIGNLESPISNRGVNMGSIYSFRADPKSVEGLLYSGFDILSLANNHIWDYGHEAFEDTLKILKENSISYIGAGLSFEEAHTSVIKEINGTKIAFLAYTNLSPAFLADREGEYFVAHPEEEQMILDIQKAKNLADVVVLSFHWGEEYETLHNSYQENLAHIAIDSGADLIVGHHPHVIQDIEEYKDRYIVYSLGNFIFDQNFSEDTRSGLAIKVIIKDKKIEKIEEYRIRFNNLYQPFLIDGQN